MKSRLSVIATSTLTLQPDQLISQPFNFCFYRFLLSYEKYLKNLGPDHVEEADEKVDIKIFDDEEQKTSNGTNGEKTEDEAVEKVEEVKPPVIEQKPKIGIKSLQFLTDPEAVAKSESTEDDTKIKIDDLIIIPNNINHAEEGGSALQVRIVRTI